MDMRSEQRPILLDPDVLSDNYQVADMHAREQQVREIALCLRPIIEARKPLNCWLHGSSGAGKTATARHVLRKLDAEAGIRGIYVNCWENPTFFAVLDFIARELRMLGAEKLSTSFKLERLKKHLAPEKLAIVLDEIDQAPPKERHSILYNLSDLPTVGLVCICNSEGAFFDLEDRVKSRLNPARIAFDEYATGALFNILLRRAHDALVVGSWDDSLLRMVAELASGDARIAIQTIKNAAYFAERENQERIAAPHVTRAWNAVKDLKKTYLFRKLTDHHRLLYELIAKNARILSGDLWRLYLKTCDVRAIRPIAVRTYSDYCNKLVELGLVSSKRAPIQGKVRQFAPL